MWTLPIKAALLYFIIKALAVCNIEIERAVKKMLSRLNNRCSCNRMQEPVTIVVHVQKRSRLFDVHDLQDINGGFIFVSKCLKRKCRMRESNGNSQWCYIFLDDD